MFEQVKDTAKYLHISTNKMIEMNLSHAPQLKKNMKLLATFMRR